MLWGVFCLVATISGFGTLPTARAYGTPPAGLSPPSPPPPNRDWNFAGGVYDRPVQWNADNVITMICTAGGERRPLPYVISFTPSVDSFQQLFYHRAHSLFFF